MEKRYHAKDNQKKVRVAIFVSNKVDLRAKKIMRENVMNIINII